MKKLKFDYTGHRIGHCTVIGLVAPEPHHYSRVWRLLCDCGNECTKAEPMLKRPSSTARCPACFAQAMSRLHKKHGETDSYLFRAWENMNRRCYDQKFTGYRNWGGRGIAVHSEWRKDYAAFAAWVRHNIGDRPSSKYSLDRRDNDGNYEPGNIRWATQSEQMSNRRTGWSWSPTTPKKMEVWERQRQKALQPPAKRGRPRRPYLDPLI